ncbi:hypothetical protein Vadar_000254 [Vaccinium darrowii]|uniref:Uncharacterized protein n=1 Tax=Vaccinium darrowii TaxID=229202 RepID=A0ACB7Y5H3_9ERIC|nr:hypothetical protein Vadar_000254 [Vaccinium darrowii]
MSKFPEPENMFAVFNICLLIYGDYFNMNMLIEAFLFDTLMLNFILVHNTDSHVIRLYFVILYRLWLVHRLEVEAEAEAEAEADVETDLEEEEDVEEQEDAADTQPRGGPEDRSLLVSFDTVSAFAERWHPETNSFHFDFGEMGPTLDDVGQLLGIPPYGLVVHTKDARDAKILLKGLAWCVREQS